jgi:hypothetical protein
MPIDFDSTDFRKTLREQFCFVLKNESREILEDALNELVRERLEELAQEELNLLGKTVPEIVGDPIEALSRVPIHLSPLDIDHRELVRGVLRSEMKKLLRDFISENVK